MNAHSAVELSDITLPSKSTNKFTLTRNFMNEEHREAFSQPTSL